MRKVKNAIINIWENSLWFLVTCFLLLTITGTLIFINLPHHENLHYDQYTVSYDADITNYYWYDIPLWRGVWTYIIRYQSEHDLITRVFPRDESINNAYQMYGIKESTLFHYKNEAEFTIYVTENHVDAAVELCGISGTPRYTGDRPLGISFVFRPGITFIYMMYRPVVYFLLLIFFRFFVRYVKSIQKKEKKLAVCSLPIIFVFISTPLFLNGVLSGYDVSFHMARIERLTDGLKNGVFPVKMQMGWYNDYGYPVGVFYGDLLLYFAAFLRLLHLPLWKCYQLFLLAVNAVMILISYYSFRRIAKSEIIGAFSTLLYCGSATYLTSIHFKGAVGEAQGMAFLPLVAVGFYLLFEGEHLKDSVICLVAGYTLLLHSHTLSTYLSAIFALPICICGIRTLLQKKRLWFLLIAAGVTFVINLGFLVPFLDMMLHNSIMGPARDNFQEKTISITQLLMLEPDTRMGDVVLVRADGVAGEMPQTIGIALMLILALAVFLLIDSTSNLNEKVEQGNIKYIKVVCITCVLSIWMSTDWFPYRYLERNIPVLYNTLAANLQFPMRYHLISAVLLSVLAALAFRTFHTGGKHYVILCKWGAICAILLTLFQSGYLMSGWINSSEGAKSLNLIKDISERDVVGDNMYRLSGSREEDIENAALLPLDDTLQISDAKRNRFVFTVNVNNDSERQSYIDFPVWSYVGYRAAGESESLDIMEAEGAKVRVLIPENYRGKVELKWTEPWYWRVAEVSSVVGLAIFIVIMHPGRTKKSRAVTS